MNVSRPDKLSHLETILYEIDMLRFSASKLETGSEWERWAFLECFLLHFRNLVEFFGSTKRRSDDLSVSAPAAFWPNQQIPADKLKLLQRDDLWHKYETKGAGKTNTISRYLQHCTEQRVIGKTWNVVEMLGDLSPLIDQFEGLLPSKERRWNLPLKFITLQKGSFSTASPTIGYVDTAEKFTK